MDGYGSYPLAMYGSWGWIGAKDRPWVQVWIGALHFEPRPYLAV